MQDRILAAEYKRKYSTATRLLLITALAFATGCASKPKRNPNSYPPGLTQPTVEALRRDNYAQIEKANTGEIVQLHDLVVHGFQDIYLAGVPLTFLPPASDRAAFATRNLTSNPDDQRYAYWIIGGGCLKEYAERNNFLVDVQGDKSGLLGGIGGSVTTFRANEPVVIRKLTAAVIGPIPGAEGAKALRAISYEGYGEDKGLLGSLCPSDTDLNGQGRILSGLFGGEDWR